MKKIGQFIFVGASILGIAYLIKKYMELDSIKENRSEKSLEGDASGLDKVGQIYEITTPYGAVNVKTQKIKEFSKGDRFIKKTEKNSGSINQQDSVIVSESKLEKDEYIIPTSVLKKI